MNRGRSRAPKGTLRLALLAALTAALLPGTGQAQPPGAAPQTPRLLMLMPSGGRAGSTFELTVTGQALDDAEGLHFSHPGVKVVPLGPASPAPVVAMKGKGKAPKQQGPRSAQRFRVTLPADTPHGLHDLRVVTRAGISNPRAFVVGDLKEFVEHEPNNDVPEAQRIELNSAVSGVIATPTDVDYYVFAGKKGQRVVVHCRTSSLDSRLPVTVQLYGGDGTYLGFNRNYRENDSLFDATLPADGDYHVRVCSFAYTLGGPDYFYRLSVSTAPWIDAVFPPMVEPGKPTKVTVYGRNLPGGSPDPAAVVDGRVLETLTVTVNPPADAPSRQRLVYRDHIAPLASALDGFELRLRNGAGASNGVLLAYAQAAVVHDSGDNDTPERAQRVALPCEIAGRIERKADQDWYVFHAKKGEIWSIEAYGERLGAPLDLALGLRSAATGKAIADLDDNPEILSPQLYTRSDDPPRLRFVAPADGDYRLHVRSRDAFLQAGPRHVYRVRITPEQPDFRVIAMPPGANNPDAAVVHRGGHQVYNVLVWRLDGFNGDITLTAVGLPPGVTVRPQVIPPGAKQAPLVVSAALEAPPWAGDVQLLATATIQGKQVVREVRAATTTWPVPQQNVPALSRLDRSLVLAVRDTAPYSLDVAAEKRVVRPGGKVTVPVKLTRLRPEMKGAIQVTAMNLPPALTFKGFTLPAGKNGGDAVFDVKNNAAPGIYTVVLRGQTGAPQTKKKTPVVGGEPSTPLTIVVLPKAVAKLKISPTQPKIRAGGKVELLVKVTRSNDYDGPFRLRLVLPPGVSGLQAEEATIAAGASETRLVLTAPPGTRAGFRPDLIVRAVAVLYGDVEVSQDAKFSVNVSK